MPGTDAQKGQLLNCVGCHTLSRPLNSSYSADDFMTMILPRMQGYVNQSIPAHPQLRRAERLMEERGDQRVQVYRGTAEFLASINLSSRPQWNFELKTLPRPTGAATRVIYTEYDLPRETISPHDVIVDGDGMVWYSSFGEQNLGRLDPKTGKVTEFPIEEHKPGFPTGCSACAAIATAICGLATCTRPRSSNSTARPRPSSTGRCRARQHRRRPDQHGQPAKLRCRRQGLDPEQRLCRRAPARYRDRRIETWEPFRKVPGPHNIYDVIPDFRNNAFFTDFRQSHIGRIDARTGEIKLFADPDAGLRRRAAAPWMRRTGCGSANIAATASACSTPGPSMFKEWQVRRNGRRPTMSSTDKNGEAWTGSMLSDQVTRLNPATGDPINYLLPRNTNIRRVFVDNSTRRSSSGPATTMAPRSSRSSRWSSAGPASRKFLIFRNYS